MKEAAIVAAVGGWACVVILLWALWDCSKSGIESTRFERKIVNDWRDRAYALAAEVDRLRASDRSLVGAQPDIASGGGRTRERGET